MTVMQSNLDLIRKIPEERQQEIHNFLILNLPNDNPFEPMSKQQILNELAESRRQAEDGDYRDFDEALDEIEAKYGL